MEAQDVNLFRLAQRNGKGIVILVNKWDLVEKNTHSTKSYSEAIRDKIAPFTDVPILFISAKTNQRVANVLPMALRVQEERLRRIPTGDR